MTTPAECAILVAIPTSNDGFNQLLDQRDSEYVKRFMGGWMQYEGVSKLLNRAIEKYKNLGLGQVTCNAQQAHWASALLSFRVVILVAHWIEDDHGNSAVEFFDGPYPVRAMVDNIPASFSGVIDLSVCHPYQLVQTTPQVRSWSVLYSEFEASPILWSEMYCSIFEVLNHYTMDYKEAATEVIREYRRLSKPGREKTNRMRRTQ
jgi:hypothetical protein